MKVPGSSCCRHRALIKSCHRVACVPGRIRGRVVFGGESTILFSRKPSPQQGANMYVLFPPSHDGSRQRQSSRLLANSLATSPLLFTLGFAGKTNFRQQRKLAIGSYTTELAAGFSFKCHLNGFKSLIIPTEFLEKTRLPAV